MESSDRDIKSACAVEQLSRRPVSNLQRASFQRHTAPHYCLQLWAVGPDPSPSRHNPILFTPSLILFHLFSSCFYRYGKWIQAEARRKLSSIRKLSVLALVSARTVTNTDLPHKQGLCCWFCIESRQIILRVNGEVKVLGGFTSNVVLLFPSRFGIGMISAKKVLI